MRPKNGRILNVLHSNFVESNCTYNTPSMFGMSARIIKILHVNYHYKKKKHEDAVRISIYIYVYIFNYLHTNGGSDCNKSK